MGKSILLLDMDGVLLTPGGYHRALQSTVSFLGKSLGYQDVQISHDQIHAFEAAGITNEWASAAFCFASLLSRLRSYNDVGVVSSAIFLKPLNSHGLNPPDFWEIITKLREITDHSELDIERGKVILPESVHWILEQAYEIEGITQRIQQEHVLGSKLFETIYSMLPVLSSESYLSKYDRSNLSSENRCKLYEWHDSIGKSAVIFTNRPTMSWGGVFGTPEGEIGAGVIGLEDLPLVGSGGVNWLGKVYQKPSGTYNKPHPAHALAAMRVGLGDDLETAFRVSGEFVEGRKADQIWRLLDGVRVSLFEDSTGGLRSLRIAKELLAERNIQILPDYYGVASNKAKAEALKSTGAFVCPDFPTAFKKFFERRGL